MTHSKNLTYKKLILLILSIFVLMQNLNANEQQNLKTNFLNKIDEVVIVVKNKALSKNDRNSNIVEVLTPMFDFELMAKLSLGRVWKKLNKKDRKKFIEKYVERMKKSYSSKLDSYNDEEVKITNIKQPKSNKIILYTDLVNSDDTLKIVYKYYKYKKQKKDKDLWIIYDVEINGISILKTDQAQFRDTLREHDIYYLIDTLNKNYDIIKSKK
jgi:phospholipid transport system substrate-binding protein